MNQERKPWLPQYDTIAQKCMSAFQGYEVKPEDIWAGMYKVAKMVHAELVLARREQHEATKNDCLDAAAFYGANGEICAAIERVTLADTEWNLT